MKRLYRSETNRMLSGVCGGLADYLNVDATFVRLVWVLVMLFGGTGLLLYVIAALVVPTQSRLAVPCCDEPAPAVAEPPFADEDESDPEERPKRTRRSPRRSRTRPKTTSSSQD